MRAGLRSDGESESETSEAVRRIAVRTMEWDVQLMAIGYGTPAPKPESRKRVQGRKARLEAKVKKEVRAACVERDGHCRLASGFTMGDTFTHVVGQCDGPSEWAHLENKRRARTMRMRPEFRHTTAGTAMMCRAAHQRYDSGRLRLTFLTARGADGPIRWSWKS